MKKYDRLVGKIGKYPRERKEESKWKCRDL